MAETTLSRRALVAGAAVSALTGSAAATTPHTDAALLDLGRRFAAAAARRDAASEAVDAAWDFYVAPEPPEALFWQPSDRFSVYGTTKRDGRRWYGDEIDSMRRLSCSTPFQRPDLSIVVMMRGREAARRDEIVAAHDGWERDKAQARAAAGMPAAEAELAAASVEVRDLTATIVATPAVTLAGVMVKARAAGWSYGGPDAIASEIDEEQSGTGETMMLALLQDLLRLAGSGGLPAA